MKFTIILTFIFVLINTSIEAQDMMTEEQIVHRPPGVSGLFYPNDADELRNQIDSFIDRDAESSYKDIKAIIVPHAGYIFSGKTAGKAYEQLVGKEYSSIIVLAPSHKEAFNGAAIYYGESYLSPLGQARIDRQLAWDIAKNSPVISLSNDGHAWSGDKAEHSIEVQIPFLQTVLPDVPIVPISIGAQSFKIVDQIVTSILEAVNSSDESILIVASSDLSHFHDLETARQLDSKIVFAVSNYDYFRLGTNLFSKKWEACGAAPIVSAMIIAEKLGANAAKTLYYNTSASADIESPDSSRVVGYMSSLIYSDPDRSSSNDFPEFSEEEKLALIKKAKHSVSSVVRNEAVVDENIFRSPNLYKDFAAFVTLKKQGELRGCIGHTFASIPLIKEVENSAKLAATEDTRFSPVAVEELDSIDYEITILSRMKRIYDPDEIIPGEHGVYLVKGNSSGLFLPQVATEQNWDRTALLTYLCKKAGLPDESYLEPDAQLFTFKAMIIN